MRTWTAVPQSCRIQVKRNDHHEIKNGLINNYIASQTLNYSVDSLKCKGKLVILPIWVPVDDNKVIEKVSGRGDTPTVRCT